MKKYLNSVILVNPDSIYTKLRDGYLGGGGIPEYISDSRNWFVLKGNYGIFRYNFETT